MGYNQGACARKTSVNQKHSRIGLYTKRSQIPASFGSILFDFNLGHGAGVPSTFCTSCRGRNWNDMSLEWRVRRKTPS
jgi:hypothetical protein